MSQPVLTPSPAPQPVLRQVVQSAVPAVASTPTVVRTITPQVVQGGYSYPPAGYPVYSAPVTQPRVVKEVTDKDRRSRMAYSTYHQAPKKGGAGGHYTWGSATDVDADAAAVSAGPVAIESKVTTGAPVMPEVVAAGSPFTGNLSSAQQFPSLGSGSPVVQTTVWSGAPSSIKEPPTLPQGSPAAASPAMVPAGSPTVVPVVMPAAAAAAAAAAPAAVDAAEPSSPEGASASEPEKKEGKNCSIQ